MKKETLSAEEARELLDYNPLTGGFRWKVNKGARAMAGSITANAGIHGRPCIVINGINYKAHRIAWLLYYGEWPAGLVTHVNGVTTDNRIVNLDVPSAHEFTLTSELAHAILDYDPMTGKFVWKANRGGRRAGYEAGHIRPLKRAERYKTIRIGNKLYLAHRVAWLMMTGRFPINDLDHINGDPGDNRFSNLREATASQNMMNKKVGTNNKSGFKGVSWDKINNKWVSRIRTPGGRYRNLGRFKLAEEASDAYWLAAKEMFGEFARRV